MTSELRGYLAHDDRLLQAASHQYRQMVEQMHAVLTNRLDKDDMQLASWRRESERYATLGNWVRWNCEREQPKLFPLCMRVRLDSEQVKPRLQHRKRRPTKERAYPITGYRQTNNQVQFTSDAVDTIKVPAPPASTWTIVNPLRSLYCKKAASSGLPWSIVFKQQHGDFWHAWLWCCAHDAKNRRPCIYFLVVLFDHLEQRFRPTKTDMRQRERIAFTKLHNLFLDTFAVPLFDSDLNTALESYRHAMQVCQSEMG